MRAFYTLLRAMAEFDLAIARSTGRNPEHIAVLAADVGRWDLEIFKIDARRPL